MDISSDERDYSDAEISEILITILRRRIVISLHPNHFNVFDDNDFFARFRLTKSSAYSVLELIGEHIKHPKNWNHVLTNEQMLIITLRVYATGGMLQTIGDLFGVSKSTVSKVVATVSRHIALLRPRFIKFPESPTEKQETCEAFFKLAKFPTVIAALDCTHIKVISPGGENPELYRNRKGFFSINVQTTCDANLKIAGIVARWPGSAHDSNILV